MPADENQLPESSKAGDEEIVEALESETDEPLPPVAEAIAERDADRPEPSTPQGRRRRYLTRRNAAIAAIGILVIVVAVSLLALILYRLGYVDRYVANQIRNTLSEYGIRAEIREFHLAFTPRTVEMLGVDLYDAQTGQKLGQIDRMLATVRIEDLYALNLRRNINLESLEVAGLQLWVTFDEQGRSNFANLTLPEPDPNRRILFSYSTAQITLKDSVVFWADERYDVSGTARNLMATIQPDDPSAPAESWMNTVSLSLTDSNFTYRDQTVTGIDISVKGRVDQTRAEIHELVLRSPLAEAQLNGTLDDWRNLRYRLDVVSTVDLTQASDLLRAATSVRGVGTFRGVISGEGSRYTVDGTITSDALAADGIRVQGLSATARASGDGSAYEGTGRVVANLLTAGDLQLNLFQLSGGVVGTGTDFRWLGELRAASGRYGGATIGNLIVSDVTAETREGSFNASAQRVAVSSLASAGARADGIEASGLRVQSAGGVTTGSIDAVRTGSIQAGDARIDGATASNVESRTEGGTTAVTVPRVEVGAMNLSGAQVGALNIAGVRLSIRDGRVEGSSDDIDARTVALSEEGEVPQGRIENVRLARPTFVLEPTGRYRASADLSLGGGVLASLELGPARARVTVTSNELHLSDLVAEVLNGRVEGQATIVTAGRGTSRVTADFSDLNLENLVAASSGRIVPLSGSATGNVDLTFPGTDFREASAGAIRARVTAMTPRDVAAIPVEGDLDLRVVAGVFEIQQADFRTPSSELAASGRFSFANGSDLRFDISSTDARELQNMVVASGFFPDFAEQLDDYRVQVAGSFSFSGSVTGQLDDPNLGGQLSLGSLVVNNRDLGSLSAAISMTPAEFEITEGRLTERDGGGVQFSVNAPRLGTNNISIDATLDRANAANLSAAFSIMPADLRDRLGDIESDVSGSIAISGIPSEMSGSANLRFSQGRIGDEPFESIVANATFSGSSIDLEEIDARFSAGQITARGNFDISTGAFNLEGEGRSVQLERLVRIAAPPGFPKLAGTANVTARVDGILTDFSTYNITIDGEAQNVRINGQDAGVLTLVGRTENRQFDLSLTTGIFGAPQVVRASVDLSDDRLRTSVETTFAGADLTALLQSLLPPGAPVRVGGRATGTIKASGNLISPDKGEEEMFSFAGLRGTANFEELIFQIEDVQLAAVTPLLVQFSPNEIFFEKTQFTGTGTNILFGGTLAIAEGGRQNLTVDGSLNLRVLNSFSRDIIFSGTADVGVRVAGTYEDPRLSGSASMAGGSFSTLLADERITVTNLRGRLIFSANQAQIDSLNPVMGNLGGGRLMLTGGAVLSGLSPSRFRFNVRGDDIVVPYPEGFRSTADTDLELSSSSVGDQIVTLLRGTVYLRRAEYRQDIELADLITRRREGSLTEGRADSSFLTAAQIELRVEGRDALVVRNNLADVVGSVSLRLTGPLDDPLISGRITATQGTLNFRNDRYELTRAFVDFPAAREAPPMLNIQAESDIRGYRVIVSLTGPLTQPNATVRSDPPLPQADVVALITTGDLAGGLTETSALAQTGVGTAASLLADTVINAPLRRASSKLYGLSLEIDPLIAGRGGSSPTARLKVTQVINRNLSLIYSTNVTAQPNQIVAVEYRVSNRLSFIAQYEQGAVSGFNARNDNFSFEIRFRQRF